MLPDTTKLLGGGMNVHWDPGFVKVKTVYLCFCGKGACAELGLHTIVPLEAWYEEA